MLVSWAGGDDHRWADSCDHPIAAAESGAGPVGAGLLGRAAQQHAPLRLMAMTSYRRTHRSP